MEQTKRGRADFLVMGDKDLLALADLISRPRTVSPADFLTALGRGADILAGRQGRLTGED
ncbi:MAG TPA: hypothetical protein VGR16_12595 [Thermomicrobiales bacterium]|nr:hypothetical protein [Thermomicrobiales bacterium]